MADRPTDAPTAEPPPFTREQIATLRRLLGFDRRRSSRPLRAAQNEPTR